MEESSEEESAEKCESEGTELIPCEPMPEKPTLTYLDADIEDEKYDTETIELWDHFTHLITPREFPDTSYDKSEKYTEEKPEKWEEDGDLSDKNIVYDYPYDDRDDEDEYPDLEYDFFVHMFSHCIFPSLDMFESFFHEMSIYISYNLRNIFYSLIIIHYFSQMYWLT